MIQSMNQIWREIGEQSQWEENKDGVKKGIVENRRVQVEFEPALGHHKEDSDLDHEKCRNFLKNSICYRPFQVGNEG
jgi:hypothetical protein